MDYGDPFGLVLFWLCYQREIIAVALFIMGFVIAGTITAHYEKKKNKKRKEEETKKTLGKLISERVKSHNSISIDEIENEWD